MNRAPLPLLLLLAACGAGRTTATPNESPDASDASTADAGDVGANDASDANSDGPPTTLEGSYDLTFQSVVVTSNPNGAPPTPPPSPGTAARLDLRAHAGGGYDAVVTPRWGDPAAFTVAVAQNQLTLSGGTADVRGGGADDGWSSFTLTRGKDGSFAGSFSGTGSEEVSLGDEVWTNGVSTSGTLTVDVTKPAAKPISTSSEGPPNALLPWDPIRVRVAEPIDGNQLLHAFSVGGDAGTISFTWATEGGSADADWAGAIQVKGLRTQWPTASQQGTLSAAALSDRVGNTSAPTTTPLTFLLLEETQTSQTFSTDVLTVGSWGGSAITFLGGFSGSDPSCESGGCAQLGVFANSVCGAPSIGMAGILAVPSAGTLSVRYRVLTDSAPAILGSPFTVDVATPGVAATSTAANISTTDLAQLASPVLGMSWGTTWATLQVPVPMPAPMLGFTVRAGSSVTTGPCGGPSPPPVNTIVLIESVTAK